MATAPVVHLNRTERGFAAVRNEMHQTETPQSSLDYSELVAELRNNFHTRKSYSYEYRVRELNNLRRGIVELQEEICAAVNKDLRKHIVEAYQGEILSIVTEIDFALNHLKEWMAPTKASTPLIAQPGSVVVNKQPKGVVLVIAPWNFPISLCFVPVVNAISAGCSVVVKPSEMTPESAKIIDRITKQYLDPDLFRCVLGGVHETTELLKQKWNHIFYTGNGAVGRIVAKAAAENLASYTLELGGKSPAYIAEDANVRVAARRVLGTKLFNNGQVCVAPDYVLVHEKVQKQFLDELKAHYEKTVGSNPIENQSLSRIVNERHFDRVAGLLKENHGGQVVLGGLDKAVRNEKFIPTTVVLNPSLDSSMMHEEIFGPVLPVLTVKGMDDALKIINTKESSLASYIYTESNDKADKFVKFTNSGGTCVNESIIHVAVNEVPFGGHSGGGSGVGSYHGLAGFNEFTHFRTVLNHRTWMDPDNRYPPYNAKDIKIFKLLYVEGIPDHVKLGLKLLAAGAAISLIRSNL